MNRRDFMKAGGTVILSGLGPSIQQLTPRRLPMRDVLVILPGIMGSVLQKDGKDVWALSGGAIARGLRTSGDSLNSMRLAGDSPDVDDLGDGIRAARIMPDAHLIPGFWKIDGYSLLSSTLLQAFDLQLDVNYFEFPYDWRRDNRVAARRLARQSAEWLRRWRERSGNQQAKLILVAHSMGGLVARYFVECLDGWRSTRRLITFGTPFRGSLNALNTLVNGIRMGPLSLESVAQLTRTFTSVYQLLPRYECYDPGNRVLVRIGETSGIPNVDASRAAAALAFHREIDECFAKHQNVADYRSGFQVHPIVGGYQTTLQIARKLPSGIAMQTAYPGADWDGDGTVPEVSAVPVELSEARREVYVAQKHSALQNTPAVLDHVIKLLSAGDTGSIKLGDAIAGSTRINLQMADAFQVGEDIRLVVRCSRPIEGLLARIVNVQSPEDSQRFPLSKSPDGSYTAIAPARPEGTYRVVVTGSSIAVPASDLFVVAGG